MKIPTKAELNGRPLFLVISENAEGNGLIVHAMETNDLGFRGIAAVEYGIVVSAHIVYDGREADEE